MVGTLEIAPTGASAPTAREVQAVGAHGALATRSHRAMLMNQIGRLLGIPPSGWSHGQSQLFERGDIRLVWLLRRLAVKRAAERIAANLGRASQVGVADLMLTVVTAARENSAALTDVSMRTIDTWHEGGLDFLWAERNRLGLPRSVTDAWRERPTFISHETGRPVAPAYIPARDQVTAYGAQLRASFDRNFRKHVNAVLGREGDASISRLSRTAMLVWKAYSFLAPGGADYDSKRTVASQSGRPFGCRTAVLFLAQHAGSDPLRCDLNDIVTVSDLNHVEWVRSAKVRAAEALYLERLLTVVRELLPPAGLYQ